MSDTGGGRQPADDRDERRGGLYVAGLIERDARDKGWRDYWLPATAAGMVSVIIAVAVSFGGRVIQGGESTAVITTQIANISEDMRDQKKILQDLLMRTSNLYTREEARNDREAAERRFQSMDLRLTELARGSADLSRRIEAIETSYRFLQQSLTDKRR